MVASTQKTPHRMVDNILQSEPYSYNTALVQITLLVYTYYTYMQDLQIEGFFSS